MRVNLTAAVGVVTTVLLIGPSGAVAQPFGLEGGGPGGGRFRGPGRFLELTEDQQEAARQIFEQRRPEMQALHEQMRENRTLLRDALESGADAASVGELVIDGHALKEQGRAMREDSKEAFESLLTPEQKRKLELLEAARAAGSSRGPHGKMGPRGGASGFRGMGPRGGEWGPRGMGPVESPDHQ
jgi:Spy/CpxP family protein refolding chaperone